MRKWINHFLEGLSTPLGMMLVLFSLEGSLLQYIGGIAGFGNNLYATYMGATDSQVGLIQMIPNLVACVLLLPLGVLSDRLKSSKTVPLATLAVMALGYLALGTVPSLGAYQMPLYFFCIAFTVGGMAIYNAQWQAFFGDVAAPEQRNPIYTLRNQFMFVLAILAPLVCGVLLGARESIPEKLVILRIFYYGCALSAVLLIFVLLRLPAGLHSAGTERSSGFSIRDIGHVLTESMKNRDFRLFFFPMLLVYMSWQFDWSMCYLGEVKYFNMNETAISIYTAVFNIGQLIAISILSRYMLKKSADYVIILAPLGLALCSIVMMTTPFLPAAMRPAYFIIGLTVTDAPQCVIALCGVQLVLRAAPEKNRSLIINLYTLATTLTNSFMPMMGVKVYEAFGSNVNAYAAFSACSMTFRFIVCGVLIWRYRIMKREGKLTGMAGA